MARLELKNVKASTQHVVEPSGAVFGREATEADIVLKDRAVSKKHARVYYTGGKWLLEDLGSSNGTFFDGQKITEPVELAQGDVFVVATHQFEVTRLEAEPSGRKAAPKKDAPAQQRTATHGKPAGRTAPPVADEQTDSEPEEERPRSGSRRPPRDEEPDQDQDQDPEDDRGQEEDDREESRRSRRSPAPAGDPASVADLLAILPRTLAYYTATPLLLALNPPGTVRDGIANPRVSALGWKALAVWALPAQLVVALFAYICGLIVMIVKGTSVGLPIVPLVVAVVGSVVGALLCHPVLTWLVKVGGGKCDATGRSNFFVMSHAALVVTAVPAGLGLLIGLVPVTILGLLPVLLTLAATLVVTYVSFAWFVSFKVAPWLRYVILGLGALACLWALVQSLGVIKASFASGPSAPAAVDKGGDGDKPEAAGDEKKDVPDAGEDLRPSTLFKKDKDAKEPAEDPKKKGKGGKEAKETKETKETKEAPAPAEATPKEATPKEVKPAKSGTAPVHEAFRTYLTRREEIEKALQENPLLLLGAENKPIREMYEKLHRVSADIRRKEWPRKGKEEPPPEAVRERLRDVEVYEATKATVNKLHDKVFRE
jgi:pSer/pThr/pTyr-binding forkhead associated (FHA) protein